MSVKKQVATALLTLGLALVILAGNAAAQCATGGTGSTRLSVAVANDEVGPMPVVSSYNLDLFTRFRISTLMMFSWGRGPVGHPGTVRSSYAVLRERLGLTR